MIQVGDSSEFKLAYGAVGRRTVKNDDGAAVVVVNQGPEVTDGVLQRPFGHDVLAWSRVTLPKRSNLVGYSRCATVRASHAQSFRLCTGATDLLANANGRK